MAIYYEAYVEGDRKIIDCRYVGDQYNKPSMHEDRKQVYSQSVDEVMRYDKVTMVSDDISTVYIFNLTKDVLEFPGRIRVDKTKKHYLIIEIFNKPQKENRTVRLYIPWKSVEAISKMDTEFSLDDMNERSDIVNTFIFMQRVAYAFGCNIDSNSNFKSFVVTGESDKAEALFKWLLHHDSKMMIETDVC